MTRPIETPRRTHRLPHDIYPVDPWAIVEHGYHPDSLPLLETVMALSNGWLGVRGGFHTGRPAHEPGVLINGFYETWPIQYPEEAYGYAQKGQTIVHVPDPTVVRLLIDGEPVDFGHAEINHWWRRLNLRRGLLSHQYRLTTSTGAEVAIRTTRMVSIARPDLLACRLSVVSDQPIDLQIDSYLMNRQDTDYLHDEVDEFDPRRAGEFGRRVLNQTELDIDPDELTITTAYRTTNSELDLGVTTTHELSTDHEYMVDTVPDEDRPHLRIHTSMAEGERLRLDKITCYRTGDLVAERSRESAEGARGVGFVNLVGAHARAWQRYWETTDVEIDADPETQQALRWVLFQLNQASAQLQSQGIPAKGLTGQAYEGHIFWDTETFVLPFLAYTRPAAAAGLIRHRYSMLDAARQRAKELSEDGALYPWRTIDGTEASAYYAGGTAQYHINAAIAYAIRNYVESTGDEELLWEVGVEMLVETARMWQTLGFERDGQFHVHGVTGPDEYTAVVDDNAYTNMMAAMNLNIAADAVERMSQERPQRYADLADRIDFNDSEPARWRRTADMMHVPHHDLLGITAQDDNFLDKEPWPFDETPEENYPLLLHYHPLVIYRFQVLKQADVVMAMYLLPGEFDDETRKANFAYYDPITTGDSSLSACVQSIVAARIGEMDLAMRYFRQALWTDLGDLHHNTTDGVHMASAGGVWMAIVHGFAGLNDEGGHLRFDPRLPEEWNGLRFMLRFHDHLLGIDINHDRIRLVYEGPEIEIEVRGKSVAVDEEGVEIELG
ncbi:MAG: glycoside hydrolase family 65 protein [Acidimicrobiia bacterium]|nr:glycoside hydrolase family 65 protein [Acidimicrobiia bacterium]